MKKNQALDDVKPLEQFKTESLGGNRLRTILLGAFAGLALFAGGDWNLRSHLLLGVAAHARDRRQGRARRQLLGPVAVGAQVRIVTRGHRPRHRRARRAGADAAALQPAVRREPI